MRQTRGPGVALPQKGTMKLYQTVVRGGDLADAGEAVGNLAHELVPPWTGGRMRVCYTEGRCGLPPKKKKSHPTDDGGVVLIGQTIETLVLAYHRSAE